MKNKDIDTKILYKFVKRRQQIFIVADDFGTTTGLITLEDAIETLLGVEIVDEHDDVVDMRKLASAKLEKRQQKERERFKFSFKRKRKGLFSFKRKRKASFKRSLSFLQPKKMWCRF